MQDSSDNIVVETTRRIFQDLGDPQTLNAAADATWKPKLWEALEESGLTLAWVPEAAGGTGAATIDAFEIARIAGEGDVEPKFAGRKWRPSDEEVQAHREDKLRRESS